MSLLDTASLIVTPNGYKEGKLYSVIPSDGSGDLSVTRATTATRVNSAGLVELVPYNLVQYSEDFSNGAWFNSEVSLLSGQSSPNGTNTAFKITATSASNAYIGQASIPVTSGNTYTASVYLKGDTSGSVSLRVDSGSTAPNNPVSYTTEWQRFTYTFTAGSTTATAVIGGYSTWTGTEAIYVYGFQLVEGSTAKDYQKTETRLNIPRLDYSNGTCPSLLVEPQRTNNVFWSNNFSTAKAYNYQNASRSSTTITAPDGLPTTGITSDTSSSIFHRFFKSVDASSNTFTSSIYAKQGTSRYLGLGVNHNGSASTNNIVVFDLQNGVIASNPYSIAATIELLSNGWYRLTHTYTYTGATAVDICVHNAGVSTYTTSGFQVFDSPTAPTTLYIFGLQFEQGSYATSYIPTTSASVTRNADVISKTGISSLIGQTEGTMLCDIYNTTNSNFGIVLSQTLGDYTNSIYFFNVGLSNQFVAEVFTGGAIQMAYAKGSSLSIGRNKIAITYKNNDFAVALNGVVVWADTLGSVPTTNNLDFADAGIGTNYAYEVNAVALWKTRLTNTQLAQLTSI